MRFSAASSSKLSFWGNDRFHRICELQLKFMVDIVRTDEVYSTFLSPIALDIIMAITAICAVLSVRDATAISGSGINT